MQSVGISFHYIADFKYSYTLVYKSLMLLYDIYCFQIQHKLLPDNVIDKAPFSWQMTAIETGILVPAYCQSLSCLDREVPQTTTAVTIVHPETNLGRFSCLFMNRPNANLMTVTWHLI